MVTREVIDVLKYAVDNQLLSLEDAKAILKQHLEKEGFVFPQPVQTQPAPAAEQPAQ